MINKSDILRRTALGHSAMEADPYQTYPRFFHAVCTFFISLQYLIRHPTRALHCVIPLCYGGTPLENPPLVFYAACTFSSYFELGARQEFDISLQRLFRNRTRALNCIRPLCYQGSPLKNPPLFFMLPVRFLLRLT